MKSFSHSLPPNQPAGNWIGFELELRYYTKEHNGMIKVESKEGKEQHSLFKYLFKHRKLF